MSREYTQNQRVVCDLFGRDSGGYASAYGASGAEPHTDAEQPTPLEERTKKIKPQFSEDLWEDALKRHCDSRQNLRNLLDRYIKPHP